MDIGDLGQGFCDYCWMCVILCGFFGMWMGFLYFLVDVSDFLLILLIFDRDACDSWCVRDFLWIVLIRDRICDLWYMFVISCGFL